MTDLIHSVFANDITVGFDAQTGTLRHLDPTAFRSERATKDLRFEIELATFDQRLCRPQSSRCMNCCEQA
jgi:hypothetical protein